VSFRHERIEVTRFDAGLDCRQASVVTEAALLAALKPDDVAVIGFDHRCMLSCKNVSEREIPAPLPYGLSDFGHQAPAYLAPGVARYALHCTDASR